MRNDDRRIYEKPGHLVRRLQQISLALFMEETEGFDITPIQYSAVLAIENHPGIDQTALCNIIAIDRSTVAEVVTRLERKKLIRRTPGTTDRRTRQLCITPAGRKLINDIEFGRSDYAETHSRAPNSKRANSAHAHAEKTCSSEQ